MAVMTRITRWVYYIQPLPFVQGLRAWLVVFLISWSDETRVNLHRGTGWGKANWTRGQRFELHFLELGPYTYWGNLGGEITSKAADRDFRCSNVLRVTRPGWKICLPKTLFLLVQPQVMSRMTQLLASFIRVPPFQQPVNELHNWLWSMDCTHKYGQFLSIVYGHLSLVFPTHLIKA